jgi:hypothetical protein
VWNSFAGNLCLKKKNVARGGSPGLMQPAHHMPIFWMFVYSRTCSTFIFLVEWFNACWHVSRCLATCHVILVIRVCSTDIFVMLEIIFYAFFSIFYAYTLMNTHWNRRKGERNSEDELVFLIPAVSSCLRYSWVNLLHRIVLKLSAALLYCRWITDVAKGVYVCCDQDVLPRQWINGILWR